MLMILTFSKICSVSATLFPVKIVVTDRMDELRFCAMKEHTFPIMVFFALVGFLHLISFPAEKKPVAISLVCSAEFIHLQYTLHLAKSCYILTSYVCNFFELKLADLR